MMTEQTGGPGGSLESDDTFDKFAPLDMGGGEAPQETAEAPVEAQAETPAETPVEAKEPPAQPVAQQPPQEDAHRVPLRELLDERDKRQALQRQIEELRRQVQPKEAPKAPEFWEQPEGNIDHRVQQAVQPLVQELIMQREQTSRALAAIQYGEDTVNEAYKDLETRIQSGDPVARFDYQRVMAQPNQYAALVQLHQQRKALNEIGNDPNAYREKLLSEALNDQAFLAKALEAAKAKAASSPSVVTYAAPGKAKGLPSISNVGAAGSVGASNADISDDDMFDKWANGR